MTLSWLDWSLVVAYILFALAVGAYFSRRASHDVDEFFLSGRSLPWWMAGTSMIATSFAADTPLVITGWVRQSGVWKNWLWWCFAIANLLGVFVFARLWRRGQVMTKAEIAELRYGERGGRALRTVLGIVHAGFTNTITLCWVLLAFAKIADVLLGVDKGVALIASSVIVLVYALLAGFWGVVVTDMVQFVMAAVGAVVLAVLSWNAIGGIPEALASGAIQPEVVQMFPRPGADSLLSTGFWTASLAVVAVNLGVGWWASESVDGSSVIVQRVAASRSEKDGTFSVLFFALIHYALRPWPWIVVALASLVVLPEITVKSPLAGTVQSMTAQTVTLSHGGRSTAVALLEDGAATDWVPQTAQVNLRPGDSVAIGQPLARTDAERAYVVMMVRYLPSGLLGLVVASLLAAFMSTIDTHINLAASFFTHDLYRARWAPNKRPEHYVSVARWSSAAVLLVAALWAYTAESIGSLFTLLLSFLGGVGPIYLLRWLWWRVEARAEIAAMVASGLTTSVVTWLSLPWPDSPLSPGGQLTHEGRLLVVVAVSSLVALLALALGPVAEPSTRIEFYRRFRPPGLWKPVRQLVEDMDGRDVARTPLAKPLLGWAIGVFSLYSALLGLGWCLLGSPRWGLTALLFAVPGCWWTLQLAQQSLKKDPN